MSIKDFSVKGVKTFKSHDGGGFSCNLYMNNKKVAEVVDDGWGGGLQFHWVDSNLPKVEIKKKEDVKIVDGVEVPNNNDGFYRYQGTPNEKILVELINDLPPFQGFNSPINHDLDTFVGDLVNDFLDQKVLKRKCKKSTLVITEECRAGEYIAFSREYSPAMKTMITEKYGNNLVKIINEDYI